jgi:hypothetical protein
MQKWEYCEVRSLIENNKPVIEMRLFTPDGPETTPIESASSTIAELGLDGWEMVSAYRFEESAGFVFKRPVEDRGEGKPKVRDTL